MKYLQILKRGAYRWYQEDAGLHAAAFSYYAPFALAPLLLLSLTVVGLLYGQSFVSSMFLLWGNVLGTELLTLIGQAIDTLSFRTAEFTVPLLGLLFFSTIIILSFNTLTSGFHQLWEIPHRGWRGWVEKSLRSILFTFILQFYLIVMMALQGFFGDSALGYVPLLSAVAIIVATGILFYLMYRLLPWRAPSMSGCLFGAMVASALFYLTKGLIVYYVQLTPVPSLFDSAGLIVAFLIWIYLITAVVYYGASVAREYDVVIHKT